MVSRVWLFFSSSLLLDLLVYSGWCRGLLAGLFVGSGAFRFQGGILVMHITALVISVFLFSHYFNLCIFRQLARIQTTRPTIHQTHSAINSTHDPQRPVTPNANTTTYP